MVYFTSDLHLGHKNICKYRPRFKTPEEHDEYMFNILEALDKRDLVFILGDFLFDGPHYDAYVERLRKLTCRIRFIAGNHDSLKLRTEDFLEHRQPLANYKGFWLSHCPIHPQEMRERKGNIHGHLHSESVKTREYCPLDDCDHLVKDVKYYNVNIEDNNYQVVPLDTIKEYFESNNGLH